MQDSVTAQVWRLAEPVVAHEGMEIVDIDYVREGRGAVLRLFLDRPGTGVTLDDLARVSRQLGDILDVHEAVPGHYTLECSSPGIQRRLRVPSHFERYIGQRIRVRLAVPEAGRRGFVGILESVDAEGIVVAEANGEQHKVRFSDISRANYEPEDAAGGMPCNRS
ncbi:MAG TPA: ribosome maturation factor RimP [Terriglobales bacterium]|nr:ribosome maturation factor RimP [Terriglobales bacterium]